MKEIYTFLYRFFIVLKVLSPILSFQYVLLWFLVIANTPNIEVLTSFFNGPAEFVGSIVDCNIMVSGNSVDMSYIAVAIVFLVLHFIFGFIAARIIDIYVVEEKRTVQRKLFEEKKVNSDLKKDLNKEFKKYNNFILLLEVELSSTYNTTNAIDFNQIKQDFYNHLAKVLSGGFLNTKTKIGEKLLVVCEDWSRFDDFIMAFSSEVKNFRLENAKKDITTDFTVALDALKEGEDTEAKKEFLAKIDSFNYKNKIVATSAFKVKYLMNENTKFRMDPLGVSRFFEKDGKHTDFDLFCVKIKRTSF